MFPRPHYEEINAPNLNKILATLPTKGLLHVSPRKLTYLNIDDNYIHQIFPLIPNPQANKPDYFGEGEMGAHISIIYPEENNVAANNELNKEHAFSVQGFFTAIINQKRYYILRVHAPSLLEVRKRQQLPEYPYFKDFSVDLHITVGVQLLDIDTV